MPARGSQVADVTEVSLDELLADPIVMMLMGSDGVSQSDARDLYEAARCRLNRSIVEPTTGLGQNNPMNSYHLKCSAENENFSKNVYYI